MLGRFYGQFMNFFSALLRVSRPMALLSTFLFLATLCSAQQTKPRPKAAPSSAPTTQEQWQAEIAKHPEVWTEFGNLVEKLEAGVKLPDPRTESRLMPLAARSTVFYAATPNYGNAAMQALTIFREQLKTSPTMRQWWTSGDMAKTGPKIEQAIESFYRVSQYLGDEFAVSAEMVGDSPNVLFFAPIKKPGLKPVLQETIATLSANSKTKPDIRVIDAQELASIPDTKDNKTGLVLVGRDYLAISSGAATLRRFTARVEGGKGEFATTPFGQRVAQAYRDNVTMVGAFDLQTILARVKAATAGGESKPNPATATLDQTGFGDAQYLVWEHSRNGTRDLSQTELSFTGARHGIAAWLGAPAAMGGLDFVSPRAMTAMSFVLANPAQIYDDITRMVTAINPNALMSITQMEQGLGLSIRDDLLRTLAGEITIEVDGITPAPAVKAMLRVNDPARLQQTLTSLLASAHLQAEKVSDSGHTIYRVTMPSGPSANQIAYTFTNGYLVIASGEKQLSDALQLHSSGASLAKSQGFLNSLPPGHPEGASALMYQDSNAMAAMQIQKISPEMAAALAETPSAGPPAVMAAYADQKSIRSVSTNSAMDAGMVLIVAAIAIPNLLRSRVAANEASAVGSMRTLNTAQVTYAATYPEHGFAPYLANLGGSTGAPSAEHAGLIDASLACSETWCERSGYRFHINAVCLQGQCAEYVALAVPSNSNTGQRSFCSTSDGVIRFKMGPAPTGPVRPPDCRKWAPLQ